MVSAGDCASRQGPCGLPAVFAASPDVRPVCEARETSSVRVSIASTPPTEVGGVATIQGFAAPRASDNRRSIRAIPQVGHDLCDHLLQTDATGSTGLFPNPLFKASDGLGGDPPPGFSVAREAESEKLSLPRGECYFTLALR